MYALIIGISCGLFGLGGGFLNPVILEMNIIPEIAGSTTSLMIFLNVAGLVVDYSVTSEFYYDYAIFLAIVTFVASIFGIYFVRKFVRKMQRVIFINF